MFLGDIEKQHRAVMGKIRLILEAEFGYDLCRRLWIDTVIS